MKQSLMKQYFCTLLISALFLPVWANAGKPQIIAHRGHWQTEGSAQNSIASLRKAQELKCAGSECDVYLTADGVVVLSHDGKVNGLLIEEATWDQLKEITLENGEKIPRLEDYLTQAAKHPATHPIIEIKQHSTPEREKAACAAVVAIVTRMNALDYAEYISFSHTICVEMARLLPGKRIAYLNAGRPAGSVAQLHAEGITGISYYFPLYRERPEYVAEAHALGMFVSTWTVNSEAELREMAALGVDYITTDIPQTALQLCSATPEAGEPKRISLWYRHGGMPRYADLAPYRRWIDMVSQCGPESISSKAFVDSCHAVGIKVWRLVPTKAESKFRAEDFHGAEQVSAYIDYLLELCRTMGYDGIDLDWEGLPEEYRAPYTAFVSALGRKLHAHGFKLGQCIPAGDYVKFLDADTLDRYCDQIRVMGYDAYYAGGPINTPMGPTSPRWWVKQQTESKWIRGFTKEKIVWGLPAYSNFYQIPHLPDNIGDGTQRAAYYRPQNVEPVWLPNDGVHFYAWGGSASSYYLWATDARSTREQLALMDAADFRHIGFWYLQLISPEMWEVIIEWMEK